VVNAPDFAPQEEAWSRVAVWEDVGEGFSLGLLFRDFGGAVANGIRAVLRARNRKAEATSAESPTREDPGD